MRLILPTLFFLLLQWSPADPLTDALNLARSHIPPLLQRTEEKPVEGGVEVRAFFQAKDPLQEVTLTPLSQTTPQPMDLDFQEREGKEEIFYKALLPKSVPFRLRAENERGDWLVELPPSPFPLDCATTPGEVVAVGTSSAAPGSVKIEEVRMAHDLHSVMIWLKIKGKIGAGYILSLDQAFAQGYAVAFLQGLHIFGLVHAPLMEQMPFGELSKAPPTAIISYEQGAIQFHQDFTFQIHGGTLCAQIPGRYFSSALPYVRIAAATVAVTSLQPFRAHLAHRSNFTHIYFLNENYQLYSFPSSQEEK